MATVPLTVNLPNYDDEDWDEQLNGEIGRVVGRVNDNTVRAEQVSNPNILHNWDFRNPVNQRGQSSYSGGAGYCIDRWHRSQAVAALEVVPGGVRFVAQTGSHAELIQRIESYSTYPTQMYTLSTEIDGVIYSKAGEVNFNNDGSYIDLRPSGKDIAIDIRSVPASNMTYVRIYHLAAWPDTDFILNRIKLEVGSVSTLANDPPADFGVELAKCQRFYEKSYSYSNAPGTPTAAGMSYVEAYSTANTTNTVFNVPKRTTPAVTLYSRMGTINKISTAASNDDLDTAIEITLSSTSPTATGLLVASGSFVTGALYRYHWTASADL